MVRAAKALAVVFVLFLPEVRCAQSLAQPARADSPGPAPRLLQCMARGHNIMALHLLRAQATAGADGDGGPPVLPRVEEGGVATLGDCTASAGAAAVVFSPASSTHFLVHYMHSTA